MATPERHALRRDVPRSPCHRTGVVTTWNVSTGTVSPCYASTLFRDVHGCRTTSCSAGARPRPSLHSRQPKELEPCPAYENVPVETSQVVTTPLPKPRGPRDVSSKPIPQQSPPASRTPPSFYRAALMFRGK